MTDPLDNLIIPDKSKIRKNPFFDDILKNGFTISIRYSPEDVAKILAGKRRLDDFNLFEHDEDELAAFEEYYKTQQANTQD